MLFLIPSTIINIITSLTGPLIVNLVLLATMGILYHFSRYRMMYKACFKIYAACTYIALIFTFFYNAGTYGPALFLFFTTFYLLIAVSPVKQHVVWTVLHTIIGFGLMCLESYYPDTIDGMYPDKGSRFVDMAFTYVICLLFLYLLTIHLRKMYDKEKIVAGNRARLMKLKSQTIYTQNLQLQKIASVQSHDVRGQVATILGLSELLDEKDPNNPINGEALSGIKDAAKNLDTIIRNINELTK